MFAPEDVPYSLFYSNPLFHPSILGPDLNPRISDKLYSVSFIILISLFLLTVRVCQQHMLTPLERRVG